MKATEYLTDENGKRSTTRLVVVVTLVIFAIAAVTDVFTNVDIADAIYGIIQTIFGVGLGGQAVRTTVKNWKGEVDAR